MGCSSSNGLAPAKPVKPVTGLRKHAGVHDLRRCHHGGVHLQNHAGEDLQARRALIKEGFLHVLRLGSWVLDFPAFSELQRFALPSQTSWAAFCRC